MEISCRGLIIFLATSYCWDGSDTRSYKGTVSVTKYGDECQDWISKVPHDHGYGIDENFPMDGSVLAAENYCRDPGGDGYLWCYTLDENIRWEYCFVPQCIGKLSLILKAPRKMYLKMLSAEVVCSK